MGLRRHQRCNLFCVCIPPTIQTLLTHPILLISIQIITFIKRDPSCTSWRTHPAPRQILTNQQWAFVGVSTTSWDPTGAGISANPGCTSRSINILPALPAICKSYHSFVLPGFCTKWIIEVVEIEWHCETSEGLVFPLCWQLHVYTLDVLNTQEIL